MGTGLHLKVEKHCQHIKPWARLAFQSATGDLIKPSIANFLEINEKLQIYFGFRNSVRRIRQRVSSWWSCKKNGGLQKSSKLNNPNSKYIRWRCKKQTITFMSKFKTKRIEQDWKCFTFLNWFYYFHLEPQEISSSHEKWKI